MIYSMSVSKETTFKLNKEKQLNLLYDFGKDLENCSFLEQMHVFTVTKQVDVKKGKVVVKKKIIWSEEC